MNLNFIFSVFWIVVSAFSYGYHISALNGAQDIITCRSNHPSPLTDYSSALSLLSPCIAMSDNLFGLLTSSYTIGGFAGSIYASNLADARGKRNTLLISAISIGLGSLLMAMSNYFLTILIGRTIIGIGCGINTVIVPIYLSQISPASIRGSIGVMNQLAIGIGIFTAQLVSLPLAAPFLWRWIFIISLAFSALQIITTPLIPNSHPDSELDQLDSNPQQSSAAYDHHQDDLEERETLLTPTNPSLVPANFASSTARFSVAQLYQQSKQDRSLANGLKILVITQLAQQLSGINAVLYYSTSIMKSVLPTQAIYITLFITAINVIMTFPTIILVDKVGRKSLLVTSATAMAMSSLILGFSINYEIAQVSSLAIVSFVASFSLGLGPIPFVILSEVVPSYAISSAGSLGLAINWAANFLVGLVFLPLRNSLSSPDGYGDGNVFFIFTILGTISTILIYQTYHHQA